MKYYNFGLLFIFLILPLLCFGQLKPVIEFDKKTLDFGTIKYQPNLEIKIKFYFKNTGSAPLVIQNVNTSCMCTVPYWTKKPISVGTRDYISVVFKVKERIGIVRKTFFVNTNCSEKEVVLHIKGIID